MKFRILILSALIFTSSNLVAQNVQAKIQLFEQEVFTEGNDLTAVELIGSYMEAKENLQKHKATTFSSYDPSLSIFEKNQKFNKEELAKEEVGLLTGNLRTSKIAMEEYLKTHYPEYKKLHFQRMQKKPKRGSKKMGKTKIKAQPIRIN